MSYTGPQIILGTAGAKVWKDDMLAVAEKHHVKSLDTAFLYSDSEKTLGALEAPKKFQIHTKAPGFSPGSMTKKGVLEGMESSLKDLGVDSVELYYLHCPDAEVPIEETLSAIQELYAAGKFKHFGLSNFKPEDVQNIYNIQKAANSVLPTHFQGNYNAFSRHIETGLFPLLRKLNIKFNAYSPIGGGFLAKDPAKLRAQEEEGRLAINTPTGAMYNKLYTKESLLVALEEWATIAKEADISKVALAYRWVAFHSAIDAKHGDGIIVGASSASQLEETLTSLEDGPLDAKTAAKVDAVWPKIEQEAPYDNYHSFLLLGNKLPSVKKD